MFVRVGMLLALTSGCEYKREWGWLIVTWEWFSTTNSMRFKSFIPFSTIFRLNYARLHHNHNSGRKNPIVKKMKNSWAFRGFVYLLQKFNQFELVFFTQRKSKSSDDFIPVTLGRYGDAFLFSLFIAQHFNNVNANFPCIINNNSTHFLPVCYAVLWKQKNE